MIEALKKGLKGLLALDADVFVTGHGEQTRALFSVGVASAPTRNRKLETPAVGTEVASKLKSQLFAIIQNFVLVRGQHGAQTRIEEGWS